MARKTWRLVDELLLFLLFLFPLMVLLGRSEGTLDRATLLFWLLLILPVTLIGVLLVLLSLTRIFGVRLVGHNDILSLRGKLTAGG